ncbi:TetR family transcriptional regulator [Leifsonia lichenia]
MTNPDSQLGLRERKHRETRARLREATFYFVDRDGLEVAKIDHIADRAGVSPRTFFNYFESKQDALLESTLLLLDDDLLAEHSALYSESDPVESVMGLLFLIGRPVLEDLAQHRHRAHIIRRHPQLVSAHVGHVSKLSEALTEVTLRTLRASPRWSDVEPRDASAHLLLGLCAGAMRSLVPDGEGAAPLPPIATLQRQSIELVRSTLGRLA